MPVITSFDAELMQQFADETHGKIYLNPTAADITDLLSKLDTNSPQQQSVSYVPHMRLLNDIIEPWMLLFFTALAIAGIIDLVRKYR